MALEDAIGALRMSKVGDTKPSPVSFRHLSMLAQVKNDDQIIESLGQEITDRLARMRTWISSSHFPEELVIKVREQRMSGLDDSVCSALFSSLSSCDWDVDSIGDAISSAFKDNDIPMKEGYRTLYLAILGLEKGPRLAPILAELDQENILSLLG